MLLVHAAQFAAASSTVNDNYSGKAGLQRGASRRRL